MQATFKVMDRGNLAIQTEVWTISIDAAKALVKYLKFTENVSSGSWWTFNVVKPINSAVRKKQTTVTLYTAGFGTSDLANKLSAVGCSSICVD